MTDTMEDYAEAMQVLADLDMIDAATANVAKDLTAAIAAYRRERRLNEEN